MQVLQFESKEELIKRLPDAASSIVVVFKFEDDMEEEQDMVEDKAETQGKTDKKTRGEDMMVEGEEEDNLEYMPPSM